MPTHRTQFDTSGKPLCNMSDVLISRGKWVKPTPRSTSNVMRMCEISEKRGKNYRKSYTKECGLNKNIKNKKTLENIR